MNKNLPSRPNLEHLRHQAKALLTDALNGDTGSSTRFIESHPRFREKDRSRLDEKLTLADSQLVIAREYGFASWPKLKRHVEQLQGVEERISKLRLSFEASNEAEREQLLRPLHNSERFQHYKPGSQTLSDADARLLVANAEGYAFWSKYESYLNLDPDVQDVIIAVRSGNLADLGKILSANPAAANPGWVKEAKPLSVPNDSVPLFCVSEAVFAGQNRAGNEYDLTQELIRAGADLEIENGLPLTGAVSYNAIEVVKALIAGGVDVNGPGGRGYPMAYALHFGFRPIAELLAKHGAELDLRFAGGLGLLRQMEPYFQNGKLIDPANAGRLGDPYEDRFRCARTQPNVLDQALFFACMGGRLEAAGFLIAKGANVNSLVPGLDGAVTILHRLTNSSDCKRSDSEEIERLPVVEFLLENGARLDIRDPKYNGTALGWAEHLGRKRIAELMRSSRQQI